MKPLSTRAYSLLMVLMLLTLLGIAISGLIFFITQSAQTSGAMIERRRVFYACDGMSRQLIAFTQAYLAANTREDVDERDLRNKLAERVSAIVPPGFTVDTRADSGDLIVPQRDLPSPVPVETITSGPFAGIQAKLQTIDIALQATKTATGAVCRTEQSISLGRIALFQFFVFADIPLLDIAPRTFNENLFARGRIHTNGRTCLGAPASLIRNPVRLDSRVTAVDSIKHDTSGACFGGGGSSDDASIIGFLAPGEDVPGGNDRLNNAGLFFPLERRGDSGCNDSGDCRGGWRSFSVRRWLGRVQDREHSVPELTLPVSPQVLHVQRGYNANGEPTPQLMTMGASRPNTRFLVEPLVDNDPAGFAENKMASRAQIRILDGVWYIKDPGPSAADPNDDGPWPGIPVWSDHPGSFNLNDGFSGEGVERLSEGPKAIGQTDIRKALEESDDPRLARSRWSARPNQAAPTPRRFSYYAYVDSEQAADTGVLSPPGPGLQYGRIAPSFPEVGRQPDHDPPAVVSYGTTTSIELAPTQTYFLPGVRTLIDDLSSPAKFRRSVSNTGWCGQRNDFGVFDHIVVPAAFVPAAGINNGNIVMSGFPIDAAPLPSSTGLRVDYPGGVPNARIGIAPPCADDSEPEIRQRARLGLLEGSRSGLRDTNFRDPFRPDAQPDFLPINIDVHALQEALADRTPGELGSYFCTTCLWPKFDGTVFVSNSWRGSMLSVPFPNGESSAIPSPIVRDDAIDLDGGGNHQPGVLGDNDRFDTDRPSSTPSLPFPLCSDSLAGQRFLGADEDGGGSFEYPYEHNNPSAPYARSIAVPPVDAPPGFTATPHQTSFRIQPCAQHALKGSSPLRNARPSVVRFMNLRTINENVSKCGPSGNQACLPRLSSVSENKLPNGLNLITNVPAYVMGDVNLSSEVVNIQTGRKASDWVPLLIGADTVTTLSNAWDDKGTRWNHANDARDLGDVLDGAIRPAATTQYNYLLLTGITTNGKFTGSGDINGRIQAFIPGASGFTSVMRLMEDWSRRRATHIFRGSIVIGWNPVYTKWRAPGAGEGTYRPPEVRDWQFDLHLNATVNQPPDSPVFDVSAIRSWRRE